MGGYTAQWHFIGEHSPWLPAPAEQSWGPPLTSKLSDTLAWSRSPNKELYRSWLPSCCPARAETFIIASSTTKYKVQSQPSSKPDEKSQATAEDILSLTWVGRQTSSPIPPFSASATLLRLHSQYMQIKPPYCSPSTDTGTLDQWHWLKLIISQQNWKKFSIVRQIIKGWKNWYPDQTPNTSHA